MGMFDKWFGGAKDYPPLSADSDINHHLDEIRDQLQKLAGEVKDPLEVVPADHEAFVFIGKPPKRFGLAWIHDGEVESIQHFAKEHDLSASQVDKLMDELTEAYSHHMDEPRYSTELGNRKITVLPSQMLETEVHEIMEHAH